MECHAATFPSEGDLGAPRPYAATYAFNGPFIDAYHRRLADSASNDPAALALFTGKLWWKEKIRGWLRIEDALKLYELAYFCEADILELGSFHGLSTTILASAVRNAGTGRRVFTVELDPVSCQNTLMTLRRQRLVGHVTQLCTDAVAGIERLAGQGSRMGLVFVDHAHTYEAVTAACRAIPAVTAPRGFVLFHDFNDERNGIGGDDDYGVLAAVTENCVPSAWEFCGVYGCAALYRLS
jgi:cephalosporin hydroxylase